MDGQRVCLTTACWTAGLLVASRSCSLLSGWSGPICHRMSSIHRCYSHLFSPHCDALAHHSPLTTHTLTLTCYTHPILHLLLYIFHCPPFSFSPVPRSSLFIPHTFVSLSLSPVLIPCSCILFSPSAPTPPPLFASLLQYTLPAASLSLCHLALACSLARALTRCS